MLIRNAEVHGQRADVRIDQARIASIEPRLPPASGEPVIDAAGGALIPGLHDHHLHLHSLAAALDSIACGPPQTPDRSALARAIETAATARRNDRRSEWLRGTGYFESVAGPLDRNLLDALCPDRPIRVQHRSGSMWFLNSAAIEAVGLDRDDPALPRTGVERDASGRSTGRLFRLDAWLRERLPPAESPRLASVGSRLARFGVTGATDATPSNGPDEVHALRTAQADGSIPQRLLLMGSLALAEVESRSDLAIGAFKILLDESAFPELDGLVDSIRRAHARGRSVAIHTVTRSEIHFALAALEAAGPRSGDRLEHASVAPPAAVAAIRRLGLTVVTQPNFVGERGDAYLAHVDPGDRPHLYPLRTWVDASVPLAAGTDAPFGDCDPWRAIRDAVERRTPSGRPLGRCEALAPERALDLFVCDPVAPGRIFRRVEVGVHADLCLLDSAWRDVREDLCSGHVAATLRAGRLIYRQASLDVAD